MAFSPTLHVFPAAILIAVGLLVVLLARLVRGGNMKLLAGYAADRVTDKPGLAAWSGNNLLLLGGLQLAAGLVSLSNIFLGILVFFLATLILVGRIVLGSRRFQR
ncbi:hypothetical protein GCM10022408_35730 [Hymenobacter fastidiosus]|uniref:DUF3784 domain-containing protein n=1 Tax=Hymenobacter fastidiosus TaxID=486264 RepID=A0ABP7T028_9BACT